METKEWTYRGDPKLEAHFHYLKEWPAGPWDGEPDKVQWEDPATKLACLAVRNPMGAWCGYVGLPAGHPWREKHYDEIDAEVHGGLTYGPEPCMENERFVCHEVDNPAEDDVLWIGFDCLHYMDASPGMMASSNRLAASDGEYAKLVKGIETSDYPRETYKPLSYVKAEVTTLAAQVDNAR